MSLCVVRSISKHDRIPPTPNDIQGFQEIRSETPNNASSSFHSPAARWRVSSRKTRAYKSSIVPRQFHLFLRFNKCHKSVRQNERRTSFSSSQSTRRALVDELPRCRKIYWSQNFGECETVVAYVEFQIVMYVWHMLKRQRWKSDWGKNSPGNVSIRLAPGLLPSPIPKIGDLLRTYLSIRSSYPSWMSGFHFVSQISPRKSDVIHCSLRKKIFLFFLGSFHWRLWYWTRIRAA